MKRLFPLSAALLLAACAPLSSRLEPASTSLVSSEAGSSMSSFSSESISSRTSTGSARSSSSSAHTSSVLMSSSSSARLRKITISAKNWAFVPDRITVKKGERIQLIVQNEEGIHGFAIPELRINEQLDKGQIIVVDLPTDRVGTFVFRCSVPCGPGHQEMIGAIVIE